MWRWLSLWRQQAGIPCKDEDHGEGQKQNDSATRTSCHWGDPSWQMLALHKAQTSCPFLLCLSFFAASYAALTAICHEMCWAFSRDPHTTLEGQQLNIAVLFLVCGGNITSQQPM